MPGLSQAKGEEPIESSTIITTAQPALMLPVAARRRSGVAQVLGVFTAATAARRIGSHRLNRGWTAHNKAVVVGSAQRQDSMRWPQFVASSLLFVIGG